jgi:hypothetical protein
MLLELLGLLGVGPGLLGLWGCRVVGCGSCGVVGLWEFRSCGVVGCRVVGLWELWGGLLGLSGVVGLLW